jgi:hypothetical protein
MLLLFTAEFSLVLTGNNDSYIAGSEKVRMRLSA